MPKIPLNNIRKTERNSVKTDFTTDGSRGHLPEGVPNSGRNHQMIEHENKLLAAKAARPFRSMCHGRFAFLSVFLVTFLIPVIIFMWSDHNQLQIVSKKFIG